MSVYGTGCIDLTLEVFLASMIHIAISLAEASEYCHVRHQVRICLYKVYLHALTGTSVAPRILHFSVTPSKSMQVSEYLPTPHQLPLSGTPKAPTNPDPINVDQEPLVFRRYRFSQYLSLLIPTFSFPAAPAYLTVHLRRWPECSPTDS